MLRCYGIARQIGKTKSLSTHDLEPNTAYKRQIHNCTKLSPHEHSIVPTYLTREIIRLAARKLERFHAYCSKTIKQQREKRKLERGRKFIKSGCGIIGVEIKSV